METLTEAYIIQRLEEAQKSQPPPSTLWEFLTDEPRPAAVLIPLYLTKGKTDVDANWHVLLTRRTDTVAEHQGQVAFPGGRAEPTDTTPEMTALREAYEEIGIDPVQVKVLGRITSLRTISNYLVTPIVGVIPWPIHLQLEETEVSHVFSIPLNWLADPDNHEIRYRTIPTAISKVFKNESHPVIYFRPYDGELLWGVSAEITIRLIETLFDKKKAGD